MLARMVDNGRFQRLDGSGRPRATADQEARLIVRSAITVLDSLLYTLRRWNQDDRGRTEFSNESRFHLCPDDHRRRVRRRPGQSTNSAFIISRHKGPPQGVRVWGVISSEVGPFWPSLEIIKHFLGQPCPFPIEHVWDMMRSRLHLLENVDDLARQLEQVWQEIPQETIMVLYYSMSRRVAACIQDRGGLTPYWARYFVTM
ncbi:transposable element Tc1 transposase [Trichonephila clavipes]|nr:transposable element Tc1 transposase [Trichonephila clavipes]